MAEDDKGLRQRLTRQGEEAVGKLAQDLLENPLFANTLARAFEAREKAMQAQTVAMGALNLPSAADIERLTRRLRSVSQRLEGIEDGVERLDERLADVSAATDTAERLRRIEEQLRGADRRGPGAGQAAAGRLRAGLPRPGAARGPERVRRPAAGRNPAEAADALRAAVDQTFNATLGRLATGDDIKDLRKQLRTLEKRVEALEGKKGKSRKRG